MRQVPQSLEITLSLTKHCSFSLYGGRSLRAVERLKSFIGWYVQKSLVLLAIINVPAVLFKGIVCEEQRNYLKEAVRRFRDGLVYTLKHGGLEVFIGPIEFRIRSRPSEVTLEPSTVPAPNANPTSA